MKKSLLSIGECMVEMAATGDGTFRQGFAGDTFNMAWHARRALGTNWQVNYFTAVGGDPLSTRMLSFMEAEGVSTQYVQRLERRMPGLYLIELNNGERNFSYWRETSAARALADDDAALIAAIADADAIFFSGITLAILAPGRRARLLEILAGAKTRGAMVAFDSNIRLRLWSDLAELREAIREAAKVSTLALPTVPDETELFGETNDEDVVRRYLENGVREIVVKAGPEPALVVWPDGRRLIGPEKQVTPVDTTGAGDSFNGTYIAARLGGDGPEAAARKAHAVAGRVIQAYGALV